MKLEVYLIADFTKGIQRIEEALQFGVDVVQLREKNISSKEYLEKAKQMRELTWHYHTPLIINDRLDIAVLSHADGVHLGQEDIPPKEAREFWEQLGKKDSLVIGISARTAGEAIKAEEDGADYIGVGAWFPTRTKLDANPISRDIFQEIKENIRIPGIAVGGITPDNCDIPFSSGASGVAVSSGILESENIEEAIKKMRKKCKYTKAHLNSLVFDQNIICNHSV